MKRKATQLLLTLPVFAFGLLLMLPDLDRTWAGIPDGTWPTAAGEIIASDVESYRNEDRMHYVARIHFRYEHGGTQHESQWWDSDGAQSFDAKVDALATIDAHPIGSPVTVHVNPELPGRGVVDPTPPEDYGAWFVRGGLVLALATAMLVSALVKGGRTRRPASPPTTAG